MARRVQVDSGLTLVELLITVVITGLIATSIAGSIVVALRLMSQSRGSLGDSGNTLLSSAYFATDVQEATATGISGSASCGTGTLLIDFQGDDFGTPPVNPATAPAPFRSYVSYVTEVVTSPGAPNTLRLLRQSCWSTLTPTPTLPLPVSQKVIVANDLSTVSPPTVTCYKQSNNPATIMAGVNAVACTAPTAHLAVMTLTTSSTAKQFQLIGTRRTQ